MPHAGETPKNPDWYNPGIWSPTFSSRVISPTALNSQQLAWLCVSAGHHETSVFYDGTEFWFVDEPRLTFEEAQLYCSANGSKLAEPKSLISSAKVHKHLMQVNYKRMCVSAVVAVYWHTLSPSSSFRPLTFKRMYSQMNCSALLVTWLIKCSLCSTVGTGVQFIPVYLTICDVLWYYNNYGIAVVF